MSDIAISAENISKIYQKGKINVNTFREEFEMFLNRLKGKKIHQQNANWVLKDINFEIKIGEVIGIIGKNGAGKSTLLKILSKITQPTLGTIKIKGKIASLLEVGTGFHPELTGKENIFLNGAILGMKKNEIKAKLEEIIDFSGVESYIDTPVKRYSSGMYVRLAFAVAAHLEPEILIIDEVLAVGDADFQKKCLGKMKDVGKAGKTVLLVSHNVGIVSAICEKSILLEKGNLISFNSTSVIVEQYLGANVDKKQKYEVNLSTIKEKEAYIVKAFTCDEAQNFKSNFGFNESISVMMTVKIQKYVPKITLSVVLLDKFQNRVCTLLEGIEKNVTKDELTYFVTFPKNIIAPNSYSFFFVIYVPNQSIFIDEEANNVCPITIYDTGTEFAKYEGGNYGNVILEAQWKKL
ncbi:MAG: ATP-binding cassette domain-containing protein [Cytophagales bacterium]|nr:MAG: ATP-binding cassette domain-containing protein [Cytophagales bacterium]